MSTMSEAVAKVAASVTALGYRAVTDPRTAGTNCVWVELPRFESFNSNVADVTVELFVVATPVLDPDSTAWLLTAIDTIVAANLGIVAGEPVTVELSSGEYPAYRLTCRMSSIRS